MSRFTRKKFSAAALVLTILVTMVLTAGGLFLAAWAVIGPQGLTLVEGLALVDVRFVGEYDKDEVVDAAMDGMVKGLGDRWSYYLSAQEYEAQKERRSNAYVGVGITVSYGREEGLLIEAVQPGGPGDQAGLQAGEIITAIDGTSLAGEGRRQGADLLHNEGVAVTLTLLGEDGSTRTVTVTPGTVEQDPVSCELLPDGTGYIKVENFYLRSADGVKAAVEDLQAQGATALLFDMRNNGGGYLEQLTNMLDVLLPEGPIFRSRDRAGHEKVTNSDADCVDLPMATLVNQDTYSAAEFFAAELQEKIGGYIVGVPTSGKGYSQQTYPLFGGGALNISTNQYFTGEGVSLIGTGLTLDREAALSEEDAARLLAGTLPHDQDAQIKAALALLQRAG